MVAGAAAAVAGHNPGAAAAGMLGGAGVGEGSLMAFSIDAGSLAPTTPRMTFLDRAHMSARGLLQFFEILQQEELMTGEREDPLSARPIR